MNAYLIRFVEGPLACDALAANDDAFDLPASSTRDTILTLVPAPAASSANVESDPLNAILTNTNTEEEFYLGGYAGI
jgi:hypothetical protein